MKWIRPKNKCVCGIITDHNNLNTYRYNTYRNSSTVCDKCQEDRIGSLHCICESEVLKQFELKVEGIKDLTKYGSSAVDIRTNNNPEDTEGMGDKGLMG